MARPCTLCAHPELRGITADLMARVPYRTIERRYNVSRSAIDRHVSGHVSKALRELAAAELATDRHRTRLIGAATAPASGSLAGPGRARAGRSGSDVTVCDTSHHSIGPQ